MKGQQALRKWTARLDSVRLLVAVLVAGGGAYLAITYWDRTLELLPVLAIAAVCLGMHLFMHGDHGRSKGQAEDERSRH